MNLENIFIDNARNIFTRIKKHILLKNSLEIIDNSFQSVRNTFIFQPYGSQQFPYFIVFTENKIIPIEIKYSKMKEVWSIPMLLDQCETQISLNLSKIF
ncbi:hypothetical protein [Candidatus Mycoplasma mahonii]|uniref:hypothetical protein n=1 Tax=Candidatus Mycoplasma mahonii TaxID=3004105 RepID=UPI0026EE6AF6|nr:hypothetical protein [Candidatus Mycoplasma mahonii]WKX02318.1 hypothetical protein O3I44_02840 [Candidatus Mycoplasma mahonii]